ncbi:MAG TPA: DivIVA domain-containing protein [Nocardioidaceae bacterium]|nr:DivIVA domain-containing protein [Nocardioidaceae bacterium]
MDVETETFRLARPGTEGYDRSEVDRFVAEVRDALSHRPPSMAPWEVRDKRFPTQRMHRGYDEHEVDEFLDKAEQALRAAHGHELRDPHDAPVTRESRRVLWALAACAILAFVMATLIVLA